MFGFPRGMRVDVDKVIGKGTMTWAHVQTPAPGSEHRALMGEGDWERWVGYQITRSNILSCLPLNYEV